MNPTYALQDTGLFHFLKVRKDTARPNVQSQQYGKEFRPPPEGLISWEIEKPAKSHMS